MNTEADIVERLLDLPYRHRDAVVIAADAVAEITKLRAERDAAARDMQERCIAAVEHYKPGFLGDDKDVAQWDLAEAIQTTLRALPDTPGVIATDETGGAT